MIGFPHHPHRRCVRAFILRFLPRWSFPFESESFRVQERGRTSTCNRVEVRMWQLCIKPRPTTNRLEPATILGCCPVPAGTGCMADSFIVLGTAYLQGRRLRRAIFDLELLRKPPELLQPALPSSPAPEAMPCGQTAATSKLPTGKADHRDRQRAYRQRQQQARVTDQRRQRYGSSFRLWEPLAAYSKPRSFARRRQENRHAGTFWGSRPGFRPTCIRCGRAGRFVDPFHWG